MVQDNERASTRAVKENEGETEMATTGRWVLCVAKETAMRLQHLLKAMVVVVGVIALVAMAPGCGNERRCRPVGRHGYHRHHRSRKVFFMKDRHFRRDCGWDRRHPWDKRRRHR